MAIIVADSSESPLERNVRSRELQIQTHYSVTNKTWMRNMMNLLGPSRLIK